MRCGPSSSVLRACTFGGMVRYGMDLSGIAREGKGREGHGHHVIISQSACAGINRNVVISLARLFLLLELLHVRSVTVAQSVPTAAPVSGRYSGSLLRRTLPRLS